jgi:SAM-dependent methyltransferase
MKVLDWSSVPGTFWDGSPSPRQWTPSSFLDVGCGIGGSTRHIARRFGASIKRGIGITLSSKQKIRATQLSASEGISLGVRNKTMVNLVSPSLSFEVENALDMPYETGAFDLVWCV